MGVRVIAGSAQEIAGNHVWLAVDRSSLQNAILDNAPVPANLLAPRLRQFIEGKPKTAANAEIPVAGLWALSSAENPHALVADAMSVRGNELVIRFSPGRPREGTYTLSLQLRHFLEAAVGHPGAAPNLITHDRPISIKAGPAAIAHTDVDLGASISKVWFKGQRAKPKQGGHGARLSGAAFNHSGNDAVIHATPETPLVGIDIDMATFRAAVHRYAGLPYPDLDQKISDLFAGKLLNTTGAPVQVNTLWCVQPTDEDLFKARMHELCAFADIQPGEKKLTLILSQANSYNASYKIDFMLEAFIQEALGVVMRDPVILRHKESVTWPDRGSLVLTSSIAGSDSTLITVSRNAVGGFEMDNGSYKYNKDKTSLYTINFGYLGMANPLQDKVFDEHSYYNFSLNSTLSTKNVLTNSLKRLCN